MWLGQEKAFMPFFIEESGDLVRCYQCLTDFERYSYSAPYKSESGAFVTLYWYLG